jgi:tetratricopeptide (TPR) repeat protein
VCNHGSRLATDPADQLQKKHDAEALGARLLAIQRKTLGEAHPDTLETLVQYCKALAGVGKLAEAERDRVAAIRLFERAYGSDHETLAVALHSVALNHLEAGRLVEGAEYFKRFAASVPKLYGWNSDRPRSFLHEFAYIMVHCGQAAQAEAFALERLPEAQRLTRPDSPGVMGLKFLLGAAVLAQGRAKEAEPLLRECLEFAHRQTPKSWSPESLLGAALLEQKKYTEAEPLLITGFEENLRHRQETGGLWWLHFTLWDAYDRVLKLYTELKQPEKVAQWQKRQSEVAKVAMRRTFRPTLTSWGLSNRGPINLAFDLPPTKPDVTALKGDPGFPGWTAGGKPAGYRFEVSRAPSPGAAALRISPESADPSDFVALWQAFRAGDYRGRRVRLRLEMKLEDTPTGSFALSSMRVERQDGAQVAFTSRRMLSKGDWREQGMVFDLPVNAREIRFSVQLHGRGTLAVRAVKFETVGPEVPADNTLEHIGAAALPTPIPTYVLERKTPENLPFPDTAQTGLPAGWIMQESRPNSYYAGMDRSRTHAHPVSLHLRSTTADKGASVNVRQGFAAAAYRGKRVRFSVWAIGQGTERPPRIYLRVDAQAERSLAFDNSSRRATTPSEWERHVIVVDVPAAADAIDLGFILLGSGAAWYNDPQFEVVGPEVPLTTGADAPAPARE